MRDTKSLNKAKTSKPATLSKNNSVGVKEDFNAWCAYKNKSE